MADNDKGRLSPEMEAAVMSTLYHDPRSSPIIVQILTGRVFETPPPLPTSEQRLIAHSTVEELLYIHYDTLRESMRVVIGEELEMPALDMAVIGKADCGCVHHAEDGIACEHDLALVAKPAQIPTPEPDVSDMGIFEGFGEGEDPLDITETANCGCPEVLRPCRHDIAKYNLR